MGAELRLDGGNNTADKPIYLSPQELLQHGLIGERLPDYAVERIRHIDVLPRAGWFRNQAGELVEEVAGQPAQVVDSVVIVRRSGDFELPVEVEFKFEDGSTQQRSWDGHAATHVFRFSGRRVERVEIDPAGKLSLELQRLNNLRYASPTTHAELANAPRDLALRGLETLSLASWIAGIL